MTTKRIVIAETIAESGLDRLRAAGFEVDVQLDKTPEEMHEILRGAQGLIVRSATMVDAAMLKAGSDLVVVARAGVGLDNIDVEAATIQGVMVVNAPQSNVLSANGRRVASPRRTATRFSDLISPASNIAANVARVTVVSSSA